MVASSKLTTALILNVPEALVLPLLPSIVPPAVDHAMVKAWADADAEPKKRVLKDCTNMVHFPPTLTFVVKYDYLRVVILDQPSRLFFFTIHTNVGTKRTDP